MRAQLLQADQQHRVLDRIEFVRTAGRTTARAARRAPRCARQIACTSAWKNSRSARGASSARSNSCIRSCQGQRLSCQRYSACSASLRDSTRARIAARAAARDACVHGAVDLAQHQRHFQRHFHAPRHPCPCARGHCARSSACSTFSVVSTPKIDRHAGVAGGIGDAARRFAGDEIEMRRVAADHAAQRDHGIVAAGGGELARQPAAARRRRARAPAVSRPGSPPCRAQAAVRAARPSRRRCRH